MKNITVLIGTNIALDYLDNREPYRKNAGRIFELCAEGSCAGFVAAHSITNIFYILRKRFSPEERKEILLDLCEVLNVSGIDPAALLEALRNNNIDDIEDCLQMNCAKALEADYIITRDLGDFVQSPVSALSPDSLRTFPVKPAFGSKRGNTRFG